MGDEFYKGHMYQMVRCILNDIERDRKIYSAKSEF